jgi:hypothetical protein
MTTRAIQWLAWRASLALDKDLPSLFKLHIRFFCFFCFLIILNKPKQQLLVTCCCLGHKAHKTTTFCHCVGSCSNSNSHTAWAPIQPATSLHRNFQSSPSAPHAFFFSSTRSIVLFLVLKGQNILYSMQTIFSWLI